MHNPKIELLGGLDLHTFLNEYWQKKPLLVKQAFPEGPCAFSGDELAGLSLEKHSRSRIVEHVDQQNWRVQHGPFSEDTFATLPESAWSLLVQNVDAMNENVNALLDQFRFLPNWRLDDVMVSYSTDGGGVGPHFDYYDVFLIQGEGKRRWQIGQHCDNNTALVPDQDMKILAHFACEEDWTVEEGDLIYIPAHIAHWGESIGESMTYSIGFRAPSHSDLLLDCTQHLNAELNEDLRYRDGDELMNNEDTGRISSAVIQKLQSTLVELMQNPQAIGEWLGSYSTQLDPGIEPDFFDENFATLADWHNYEEIRLSHFSRSAYMEADTVNSQAMCFINGEAFSGSTDIAKRISNYQTFSKSDLASEDLPVIESLIKHKRLFVLNS